MKEKLIVGICILFLNSFLAAQNIELTLKDGTIIEGNTSYNGWGTTPDEIKITHDNDTQIYRPFEVAEFTVNGDRYVSKSIEISYISKRINLNITDRGVQEQTDSTKLESVQKEVFLRVVVLGDASLYTYNDNRTHYFVEKDGKTMELIRLKRSGRPTLNRYVGQLNILFSDCEKMSNNDKVQFSKSGLKRAVLAYNECKSGTNGFVEIKRPLRFSLYLVGGYKLTSYSIDDPLYGNKTSSDSGGGTPAYGVGFDLSFGRTDRLQIYSDIVLQQYEYEATYRNETSPQQFTDFFVDLDLSYLEIAALLRYNFGNLSNDRLGVFANGGINQALRLSDDSTEFADSVFFSDERRTEREPLNGDIGSSRTSFVFGVGLRYKFITGEIRYDFDPRLSDKPTISNTSDINFLLSFKVL